MDNKVQLVTPSTSTMKPPHQRRNLSAVHSEDNNSPQQVIDANTSLSNRRQLHRRNVSDADNDFSKIQLDSSDDYYATLKKKTQSNSFHALNRSTSRESTKINNPAMSRPKSSKSFHVIRSQSNAPSTTVCKVHPDVSHSTDDKCPKCTVILMKAAAKELERRAAELELDRLEMEEDLMETKKKKKLRDRKLVNSLRGRRHSDKGEKDDDGATVAVQGEGEQRRNELDSMLLWSSAIEKVSSHKMKSKSPSPPPPPRTSDKETRPKKQHQRPPLTRQFSLGQVAQSNDVSSLPSTHQESLIKIARLREGDGAFVMRSDSVWTYATLRTRESGPDACLVFTVNGRGATKKFPLEQWAKYVKLVNEEAVEDSDDEDEIRSIVSLDMESESSDGEEVVSAEVSPDHRTSSNTSPSGATMSEPFGVDFEISSHRLSESHPSVLHSSTATSSTTSPTEEKKRSHRSRVSFDIPRESTSRFASSLHSSTSSAGAYYGDDDGETPAHLIREPEEEVDLEDEDAKAKVELVEDFLNTKPRSTSQLSASFHASSSAKVPSRPKLSSSFHAPPPRPRHRRQSLSNLNAVPKAESRRAQKRWSEPDKEKDDDGIDDLPQKSKSFHNYRKGEGGVPKKNWRDLNAGGTISMKRDSFFSALKSIHDKRESVLVSPLTK
eukprot:scaffold2067_cov158-Alexandrium_tamarense.AAC.1